MTHQYYKRIPSRQCGWVTKLSSGGLIKSWNRRWLILSDTELQYFKTEEDRHVHGSIDLNLYYTITRDTSCKKSQYAFIIEPRKDSEKSSIKSHLFYTETLEEMQSWIKAIEPRLGQRSVLDKWLNHLGTNQRFNAKNSQQRSPSRSESNTFTNSTSFRSISTGDSPHSNLKTDLSSDGLRMKCFPVSRSAVKPTSVVSPFSTASPASPTSSPVSATTQSFTTRRKIAIAPLVKADERHIIPLSEQSAVTATVELLIQSPLSPPPQRSKNYDLGKATKRRSNSMPRFDVTKTTVTTPTFGNFGS